MMLKSQGKLNVFLSADDHLQLALFLLNQAKSIKWLKGWLPPDYDHKNIYALLTRLKQRQFISQAAKGQFQLSAIGRDRLFRLYPLLAAKPVPLGYFFTAIVDFGGFSRYKIIPGFVPASHQKKPGYIALTKVRPLFNRYINKIFKRWGWGRLTRGIYLSGSQAAANALSQYLAAFRLTELVTQGVLTINENQKRLADRIFNLTSRNADWRLIIDRINEWERINEPERGLRLIRKDFLILLVTEPLLPTDLLPQTYWISEAKDAILNE